MNKPCRNYNKKFFGARYLSEVPGGVSIWRRFCMGKICMGGGGSSFCNYRRPDKNYKRFEKVSTECAE
jgi:hypothetical protein